MALETDREVMNMFEEMFGPDPYNERGQDSAFMDDQFGGWLTLTVHPLINNNAIPS